MTIPDERRLVTVLFAGLVGFTGRSEQRDPRRLSLRTRCEATWRRPRLGASTSVPLPRRAEAAAVLDREHRRFDAAKIRLWLAEEASDPSLLADATDVFEELAAHPYLARAPVTCAIPDRCWQVSAVTLTK